MTAKPRPLVAGNWKMNGLKASLGELQGMLAGYGQDLRAGVDLLVCPPATLIAPARGVASGAFLLAYVGHLALRGWRPGRARLSPRLQRQQGTVDS